MLTIGVLLTGIGLILILFNSINFSFIKDQIKDKKQIVAGYLTLIIGIIILVISIRNLMAI